MNVLALPLAAILAVRSGPVPTADPSAPIEALTEADLRAEAVAAFEAQDYDRVVELAVRAYALTGAVRHLYAQAHAERFRGDCQAALALYARVLAGDAEGTYGELSRDGIRLCEEQLNATATTEPPPPQPPAPSQPATAPADAPAPAKPVPPNDDQAGAPPTWARDPVGGALLGVGLVSLAIGGGLTIASSSASSQAERAGDETEYADARKRSSGLLYGGAAALVLGGALTAGAIARYILVRRQISAGVTLAPGPGLVVRGRF